jgi:phosphopantetheinyl transferase (holo-ACP synthase)
MSEEEKVNETDATQSENVQETPVEAQEQKTEEVEFGFNPDAFFEEAKQEETTEDNNTEQPNVEDKKIDDSQSEEFSWDKGLEYLKQNGEQENTQSDSTNVDNSNTDTENSQLSTEPSYEDFFKEVGLEVKTKEEFKEIYKNLQEENELLRKNLPEKNEKIDNFEKLIKLDDKELVERSLIADGFEGVELENAIERMLDNDMIDIEAKKVRNTLNKAIATERDAIIDEKRNQTAKQEKDREESIKSLNDYLNSTEEMFGFKIASTPEKMNEIRENHQEYIVSGKFLQDITQTEKSLADCAWLWANKEVILKAMQTKGFNIGRKDVLDQIGNPDVNANSRTFADPKGDGEFNPGKFMAR